MVTVTKIYSTSQTYRRTVAANFPRWRWTHPRFPLDGSFITRVYNTEVRGYEEKESSDKKKDINVENKSIKKLDPVLAYQNVIKELKQMIPQDYVYNTEQMHVIETNKVDDKYQTEKSLNVEGKDEENKSDKPKKKKRNWIRNMFARLISFLHKKKENKYKM